MSRIWLIGIWLLGCTTESQGYTLVLQMQTDLLPGIDFDALKLYALGTESSDIRRDSRDVAEETFLPDGRAFEVSGLQPGNYRVDLILQRSSAGRPLYIRPLLVTLNNNLLATVPVDRSCLNVACPPVDDPTTTEDESLLEACLGGQCVDPRCTVESPEFCGDVQRCASDDDCESPVSCADAACYGGLCWAQPKAEPEPNACTEGQVCHPENGCVSPVLTPASCSDGQQNGGEQGLDCGGNCAPCDPALTYSVESCLNGLLDAGEEAVDCGGSCTPCLTDTYDCAAQSDIPQHECHALLAFYASANGERWDSDDAWSLEGSPCSWAGITCENGQITLLDRYRTENISGPSQRSFSILGRSRISGSQRACSKGASLQRSAGSPSSKP